MEKYFKDLYLKELKVEEVEEDGSKEKVSFRSYRYGN